MLRLLAFLLVTIHCGTEGFLFGTTHTRLMSTTMIPRYPSTTGPQDCDLDKLLNCTSNLIQEFNLTNTDSVDPELLYEFTCGSRGRALVACIREQFENNCTGDDSAIYQGIISMLPDADTLNSTCGQTNKTIFRKKCHVSQKISVIELLGCSRLAPSSTMSHVSLDAPGRLSIIVSIPAFVDLQRCMVSYSQSDAFTHCVTNATSADLSNMCGTVQASIDCSYKYVDLLCPHLLQDFLALTKSQYSVHGLGDCNIQVGSSPQATTCDPMMLNVCPITAASTEQFVDVICRPGDAAGRCFRKINTICDKDNPLSSNELYDKGCRDKTAFGQFIKCSNENYMKVGVGSCLAAGLNDTTSESSWCVGFHTAVACYNKMIQTVCPSVMPFYHNINVEVERDMNCSAIVAKESSGTASVPAGKRPTSSVAPMSTPTSSIGSIRKSILLQMILHLQHEAVSLQQAASDMESEARLLHDLLQGNDVINSRK